LKSTHQLPEADVPLNEKEILDKIWRRLLQSLLGSTTTTPPVVTKKDFRYRDLDKA
jgi:hypothetical protein